MKYFHYFPTVSDAVKGGQDGLESPHISFVGSTSAFNIYETTTNEAFTCDFDEKGYISFPKEICNRCLKFHADALQTIAITNAGGNAPSLEYSFDRINWATLSTSPISFGETNKDIYVRGNNPSGLSTSTSKYSQFVFGTSASVTCEGNIMHLLSYTEDLLDIPSEACFTRLFLADSALISSPSLPATGLTPSCYRNMLRGTKITVAPELPATTLDQFCYAFMFQQTPLKSAPELPSTAAPYACYYRMFYGCTELTSAPLLPATIIEGVCYYGMFEACTSLVSSPSLPANNLAEACYDRMFYGCTALTTAPSLRATVLADSCCSYMFYGCTSLTSAPSLPIATTLAEYCYSSMFYGCTSLTSAPSLPATTMAYACCYRMFYECTSLTSAPSLPATTMADGCYYSMFYGCTALATIPSLPAATLANDCYAYMFSKCTSLTKIADMSATSICESSLIGMYGNCSKLDYLLLDYPYTTIGQEMFINDIGIKDIHFSKNLKTIGYQNDDATYNDTMPWALDNIYLDEENPNFILKDDALYSTDGTKLYATVPWGIATGYTDYSIAEGTTEIRPGAFRTVADFTSQEEIDSEFTVNGWSRPHMYMTDLKLTAVTVPSTCTFIGDRFLQYDAHLQSITIKAVTPPTLATTICFSNSTCPIYVPADSVDAYKAATNWSNLSSRITAIP